MARKTSKVSAALVSRKVRLAPEDWKALDHEAVDRGCTVSQVITDLLGSRGSRLVITRRSRGTDGPQGSQGPSAPAIGGPLRLAGTADPEVPESRSA